MQSKRLLISWLVASVVMFLLSYMWHGVFLNDYNRLNFPKEIFLILSVIVYLILGFVIAKAIDLSFLVKKFKRKPFVRGIISGATFGFVLYIVMLVVGVSFSAGTSVSVILFDLVWQMIEQTMGGMAVAVVHYVVFDPMMIAED